MTKLYDSDNPAGYRPNRETGRVEMAPGICSGMTAVWCLKMSLGIDPASTQPGKAESTYLQFAYDMFTRNIRGMVVEFLPRARLYCVDNNIWKDAGRATMGALFAQGDGKVYFWGYPGHALGVARRDGKYYLFNPDEGLHEFDTKKAFTAHMETRYKARLDAESAPWTLFEVAHDPNWTENRKYLGQDD